MSGVQRPAVRPAWPLSAVSPGPATQALQAGVSPWIRWVGDGLFL